MHNEIKQLLYSAPPVTIAQQWDNYRVLVGLPDEALMHPTQAQETKRAFYGAMGQIIIYFTESIPEYADRVGDEAAGNHLRALLAEVAEFWQQQV